MAPIILKNSKVSSFLRYHREIFVVFCAALALFVALVFPAKVVGEQFWLNLFLFFVFPALVVRFLLKEPLSDFGLAWGNPKKGVIFSVVTIATFILINYLILRIPALKNQITLLPELARSFWSFLWYELTAVLVLHFSWEFFFRGFLQMGLEKKLGFYILPAQALIQTLLVIKGTWLMIGLVFLSALAAGLIARQSRSVIYSFVSMWLISVSLDIMLIRMIHLGTI